MTSKSRRPLLYSSCPLYGWEVLDWVGQKNPSASYTGPCLLPFPALFGMVLYPYPRQERSQSRRVRGREHSNLRRDKAITKRQAGVLTGLLTWEIHYWVVVAVNYLSLFYQYWITPCIISCVILWVSSETPCSQFFLLFLIAVSSADFYRLSSDGTIKIPVHNQPLCSGHLIWIFPFWKFSF